MESVFNSAQKVAGTSPAIGNEYDHFIDLAVHELDTPFRKFLFLADQLSEKFGTVPDETEAAPYLKRISTTAKEIRMLIDDLRLLTSIKSGENEFISCNLNEIAGQAVKKLDEYISEKQAVITIHSLPVVKGNRELLTLLFSNLLQNALKFSKPGMRPEVHIRSSRLQPEEKELLQLNAGKVYYQVEVSDNSIGVEKQDMEKIFLPFVRLHGKSQFPGNGLGLVICKRIVDIHGGVIYCESDKEKGSTFIFILPETD